MTSKGLLTIALLGFVAVSVATLVFKETGAKGTAAAEQSAPTTGAKLIAYYLHGKVRCVTCNDIEKTAKEAVEAGFAEDLKSGRIEWRAVNYEEPGNEHFAKDFKLAAPCVVLSSLRDGRQTSWKSLPEVWELIGDKPKFRSFIEENIREQLSGVTGQGTAPAGRGSGPQPRNIARRAPPAPRPRGRTVHPVQGDGPHPRRAPRNVSGAARRGLPRRLERPGRGREVRGLDHPDADFLRCRGQGAVPARGLLLAGGDSRQVARARGRT